MEHCMKMQSITSWPKTDRSFLVGPYARESKKTHPQQIEVDPKRFSTTHLFSAPSPQLKETQVSSQLKPHQIDTKLAHHWTSRGYLIEDVKIGVISYKLKVITLSTPTIGCISKYTFNLLYSIYCIHSQRDWHTFCVTLTGASRLKAEITTPVRIQQQR